MSYTESTSTEDFERFRSYLTMLANVTIDPRLAGKIGESDIVQQTLLEAHQQSHGFRGTTEAERAAWLRSILANNVKDALKHFSRGKRDVFRERSIHDQIEQSSLRIAGWLADEGTSPLEKLERQERALQLAQAMQELPDSQRIALTLQHWHGWSLAEIGEHLDRSPDAVAGLLKRGLSKLRQTLGSM